jgi:hypothetical protein
MHGEDPLKLSLGIIVFTQELTPDLEGSASGIPVKGSDEEAAEPRLHAGQAANRPLKNMHFRLKGQNKKKFDSSSLDYSELAHSSYFVLSFTSRLQSCVLVKIDRNWLLFIISDCVLRFVIGNRIYSLCNSENSLIIF